MASDWYGADRLAASTALNTSPTARNAANAACHPRRLPALTAIPRTKNTLAQPPTSATSLGVHRPTSLILRGVFATTSEGVRLAKASAYPSAQAPGLACVAVMAAGRVKEVAAVALGLLSAGPSARSPATPAAISAATPCKSHGWYHLPYLLSSFTTGGSCAPHTSRIGPGHQITFRGS